MITDGNLEGEGNTKPGSHLIMVRVLRKHHLHEGRWKAWEEPSEVQGTANAPRP